MPCDISYILLFIVVTKSHVGLHSSCLLLLGSEIEGEDITFQKLLVHHLIKNWDNTWLCKFWIGHTNDGFEVVSSKNCSLLLNITELLVFNMDLSTRLRPITRAKSEVVSNKMSHECSRSKQNSSSLISFLVS